MPEKLRVTLWQPAVAVKMFSPIGRCRACVRDRVTAMYHVVSAYIDSDVGNRPRAGVCACEKDKVAGFRFRVRDRGTDIKQALRRQPPYAPAGMVHNITDKTGAVKSRYRGIPSPYISKPKVFLGFCQHCGKYRIAQRFRGDSVKDILAPPRVWAACE